MKLRNPPASESRFRVLRVSGLLAVAVAALATTAHGDIVEITDCAPDVIRTGDVGVLRNDIVCEGDRIFIQARGKLDLAGYTITKIEDMAGYTPPSAQEHAVYCPKQCTVFSSADTPGRIVGPGPGQIDTIYGIEGGTYYDSSTCPRMRVENVEVSGFDAGISAGDARMFLFDVTLHDNVVGARAERLTAKRINAYGNTHGVSATRVKLRESTCSDSDDRCVNANWAHVRDSVVQGSGTGVWARRMRIIGSTLSASGVDIASEHFPRLDSSTCETSSQLFVDPPQSWGVCALD